MNRFLVFTCLGVAFLTTGCHQAIRLPRNVTAAPGVPVERGFNSRAKLLNFEIPSVKVDYDQTHSLKVNGLPFGVQKVDTRQTRTFVINKAGTQLASASCVATQKGTEMKWGSLGRDDSRHELNCAADGFELSVKETGDDIFNGMATRGDVSLRLVSTNDMAEGAPASLSGFHVYRGTKWLGSFEYFYGGKVYLAGDLTPEELDAFAMTTLSVVSTDGWLGKTPSDNEPRSPMGFAHR